MAQRITYFECGDGSIPRKHTVTACAVGGSFGSGWAWLSGESGATCGRLFRSLSPDPVFGIAA
ncbi:hypothetical protein LC55x_1018 [Lysobacter capsici]|nr:hypothetical protein LC55x_1018 [Lysobacter capsici]